MNGFGADSRHRPRCMVDTCNFLTCILELGILDQKIEVLPLFEFVPRSLQTFLHDLFGVSTPASEPFLEHLHRGRHYQDGRRTVGKLVAQLNHALVVDIEEQVSPGFERIFDDLDRSAVEITVNLGPFGEPVVLAHRLEFCDVDEMIRHTILFLPARLASRVAHAQSEAFVRR